jgi:hypothetical protein
MFAGIKDNISPTIAALATILICFRPACCWPWNGCAGATRRPRASEPRLPLRRPDMLQQLKDPSLLRQQAYVNGAWCDADGATHESTIPPTANLLGRAHDGRGRDPPRHRGRQRRLAGLEEEDRQGTQRHPAPLV